MPKTIYNEKPLTPGDLAWDPPSTSSHASVQVMQFYWKCMDLLLYCEILKMQGLEENSKV